MKRRTTREVREAMIYPLLVDSADTALCFPKGYSVGSYEVWRYSSKRIKKCIKK